MSNHVSSAAAPDPDAPGVLHRAAGLIEAHRHEPSVSAIGNPSIARELRSLARQLQARLPEPDATRSAAQFAELDRLAAAALQDDADLPGLSPELFVAGARFLVAYMDRSGVYAREIPVDAAHQRGADLMEMVKNYSPSRLINQYREARRTEAELAARMAPPGI